LELVTHSADAYAKQFTSALDAVLQQVETDTLQQHPQAHMLSGHVQGMLLQMLSCMLQPQRILEIGTFTGFSALCLAKGLPPHGILHTIELREEDAATAQKYFAAAGVIDKVKLHIGDAKTIVKTLHEVWDLVFIDADKTGYIDYYELTLPHVKPGGFIIADNVLFHGEVLTENIKGKNARAIQAFNEHVQKDTRTQQVLLTVRDGLLVIQKI
jgi:caffeoyl-CoA O-methyltransferase